MISLMIVDDSLFMRTFTKDMLKDETDISVVIEARNGEDAINKLNKEVDVVLLDIEMPKKNGLEVLEHWSRNGIQVPVIMFSSLTKSGASETIKALELGAFEFVEKVSNTMMLTSKKDEIVSKIRAANISSTNNKQRITKKHEVSRPLPVFTTQTKTNIGPKGTVKNLILIGCSTGGPKALKEILPLFPSDLNAAIMIVQHMPKGDYIRSLSESLNRISKLTVKEAGHGESLKNGVVYLAPGGKQMKINLNSEIQISEEPPESGHAPSVDYLFREVLRNKRDMNIIPVVLTGMGADGSRSALNFSEMNIPILVESEETSVVFGMPKKIIESGAEHIVVNLEKIPFEINNFIK